MRQLSLPLAGRGQGWGCVLAAVERGSSLMTAPFISLTGMSKSFVGVKVLKGIKASTARNIVIVVLLLAGLRSLLQGLGF